MLHYPKIPGSGAAPLGRCVAFDKLDGTNLHWCWERDFGWHAFGSRRDEFNLTATGIEQFNAAHPGLEEAAPVFLATIAEPLGALLRDHVNYAPFTSFKAFTEFAGPNSFAGAHEPGDPKQALLFDVWAEGYGFVSPAQFVADFGHLPSPRVVHTGKLTGTFLEAVREGKYGVAEGVVCKGGSGGGDVWMVKVKTYAYLARLKTTFGTRWEDYWE
ncbi:hypothetical protein J8F10_00605 [Gemmata sp. G18]|uniref:RNA ligase domain-containing protein n=1 Tax=Gemmata palustris TaxID=2822762 RepID=A0ABS5BJC1_9BACT|nr:RNA ligase family protein [Gemmata palustris]MBP3953801.1 hypothetical protein [Gemmata palustris]